MIPKKRKKQIRVRSEYDWCNSEIVFGDPVAKQATRAEKQAEARKESLRKYHARQGRDTRQDMVKRFGSV